MLIVCDSIEKKELKPLENYFSFNDIKEASLKAKKGLGIEIKGSFMKATKLVKVYLTGKRGAGRIVFLVLIHKDHYVPIILRLKNDKLIGNNISIKNSAFEKLLNKYLNYVQEDINNGNFSKYEME
jgi:hypothetical protein